MLGKYEVPKAWSDIPKQLLIRNTDLAVIQLFTYRIPLSFQL